MITIKFEEKGQDFKEWIIDNGVIVDCQPFKSSGWLGKKVLIVGDFAVALINNEYAGLNYKIISKEETNSNYVKGFQDAKNGKKNQSYYYKYEQYRFGYCVSLSFLKGQ